MMNRRKLSKRRRQIMFRGDSSSSGDASSGAFRFHAGYLGGRRVTVRSCDGALCQRCRTVCDNTFRIFGSIILSEEVIGLARWNFDTQARFHP
jgi:hypothetical protein